MTQALLERQIAKRPRTAKFGGRILYLTTDPTLVKRQLDGENIHWKPDTRLRDDISTDEITPAYICYYYDDTLGEFPYLGLKCGDETPVARGAVKKGGFVASVSGKRRGKGSSREQSPYAEMCAGIRVVVAENVERIYKQNCQNLGLYVTTNFDVLDRIEHGEEISIEEFTRGEDPITCEIIEYGGLFNFNVARLQGQVAIPAIETAARPMTLAEKILAKHMVVDLSDDRVGVPFVAPGDSGFVRTDLRFSHEYVTPMAAIFFEQLVGKTQHVNDPSSILFFRDHLTFLEQVMPVERVKAGLLGLAQDLERKQREFAAGQGIRLHGELKDRPGSQGICHSVVLEDYALPGAVIVGSDSHTPHSGAIGCLAFGIGTTDVFNSWITKDVRVRVPPSVQVVVRGKKPANVTAKDIMLEILRHPYVRNGDALGQVIEYSGDAVEDLSVDERATLTNMAAEIGGFTGIVAPATQSGLPHGPVVEFLMQRRGLARESAEQLCAPWHADPGATYARVIEIDASSLKPMVARPGDPGNGLYIDQLEEEVKITGAYGGSCTGGKNEDMDMYAAVFKKALAEGKRIAAGVQCYIQFGSQATREYAANQGYIDLFRAVGVQLIEPSCGACINAGPGASKSKDEVTISAQNRNFPGRSGPGQVYLASPYTVAASAIAGKIVEPQL